MGPDAKDDDTLSRALWTDCSLECSVAMLTSCYYAYLLPTEFNNSWPVYVPLVA